MRELGEHRAVFRELNGREAPPPAVAGWVFCDADAGRAGERARRYIGE